MPILPVIPHTGPLHRDRPQARSTWIAAAYWVLGLWAAALAATTAYLYLVTGGSFDYVEGVALGHQLMSAGAVSLYGVPADQPSYSVPLYGPVFYTIYGLLLAFVCTVLPSFMINEAIRCIGATKTTVVGSIGPVMTMLLAVTWLGEPTSLQHILGMLIVVAGVSLVSKK